jgi:phage regulator Rha-like protein
LEITLKVKNRIMTTNAQMKNINAYVEAFLAEHGDENILELWQDEEVQKQFNKLINATKNKGSGKKDPNKPKRGKSAYLFFCADNREKAKEELGEEAKATEVTAELGRRWNELKASTKASAKKKLEKYEELAREDKERYEDEMNDYNPPPSDGESDGKKVNGKKGSGKKDTNKPKRGKSAYLFFCADNREKAKEELGEGAKATEITAELGRQWNELKASTNASDKKKLEKYEEQAREDKERYESEMVDYSPKDSEEDAEGVQIVNPEKVGEKKESGKKESGKKESGKKVTGYVLFCKEHREKVVADNPEIKGAEITKILAGMWKDLDSDDQEEWKYRASMM